MKIILKFKLPAKIFLALCRRILRLQDLNSIISHFQGFFRRSIQQKMEYRKCSKNQKCAIVRTNRNRCQVVLSWVWIIELRNIFTLGMQIQEMPRCWDVKRWFFFVLWTNRYWCCASLLWFIGTPYRLGAENELLKSWGRFSVGKNVRRFSDFCWQKGRGRKYKAGLL